MVNRTLNQYQVIARIGAGGMGEVFRARDTRLHRNVVIKVLPMTDPLLRSIHAQSVAVARLAI